MFNEYANRSPDSQLPEGEKIEVTFLLLVLVAGCYYCRWWHGCDGNGWRLLVLLTATPAKFLTPLHGTPTTHEYSKLSWRDLVECYIVYTGVRCLWISPRFDERRYASNCEIMLEEIWTSAVCEILKSVPSKRQTLVVIYVKNLPNHSFSFSPFPHCISWNVIRLRCSNSRCDWSETLNG